jgi:hypothetical protein
MRQGNGNAEDDRIRVYGGILPFMQAIRRARTR